MEYGSMDEGNRSMKVEKVEKKWPTRKWEKKAALE